MPLATIFLTKANYRYFSVPGCEWYVTTTASSGIVLDVYVLVAYSGKLVVQFSKCAIVNTLEILPRDLVQTITALSHIEDWAQLVH